MESRSNSRMNQWEAYTNSHRRAGFLLASSNKIKVQCHFLVPDIKVNRVYSSGNFHSKEQDFQIVAERLFTYIITKFYLYYHKSSMTIFN